MHSQCKWESTQSHYAKISSLSQIHTVNLEAPPKAWDNCLRKFPSTDLSTIPNWWPAHFLSRCRKTQEYPVIPRLAPNLQCLWCASLCKIRIRSFCLLWGTAQGTQQILSSLKPMGSGSRTEPMARKAIRWWTKVKEIPWQVSSKIKFCFQSLFLAKILSCIWPHTFCQKSIPA